MMKLILLLLVITIGLSNGQKIPPKIQACQRIVCYTTLNGMRRQGLGALSPDEIDPKLCTQLIVGHTSIVKNKLQTLSNADLDVFTKLKALKNQQPLLEIIIAVEGTREISELVMNKTLRAQFASSVVTYLRALELDGVDFALVNSMIIKGENEEKMKLSYLMMDLQTEFYWDAFVTKKPKLLLVADVGSNDGKSEEGYEVLAMSRYLDFINIMTFNYHGAWDQHPGHNSPLFSTEGGNTDATLNFWVERGMLRGQINVAIPTFGRSYTVKESADEPPVITGPGLAGSVTRTPGFLTLYEMCKTFNDEGEFYINNYEKAAYYTYGNLWIVYDNTATVRYKIQYIRERGYGGIVLYTLDFDDITGTSCGMGTFPLTKVAKNACGIRI